MFFRESNGLTAAYWQVEFLRKKGVALGGNKIRKKGKRQAKFLLAGTRIP